MLDGALSTEMMTGFAPPRVEAPKPLQNFTPLPKYEQSTLTTSPRFEKPTITEPPKYETPTDPISPADEALTKKLMAQIMEKPKPKTGQQGPPEVKPEINVNIPQEAKNPQGFWAKIFDWFRNIFRSVKN